MSAADIFLYNALYDLSAGHKQVLLFKKGDRFIPVPKCSTNPNWTVCVDVKGTVGYVPYTYVDKQEVSVEEFVYLIDDALEKLHVDSPTSLSKLTIEAIRELTVQRQELIGTESTEVESAKDEMITNVQNDLPTPTQNSHEDDATTSTTAFCNSVDDRTEETQAARAQTHSIADSTQNRATDTAAAEIQTDSITDFNVPIWLVPSLIENVRHKTQISHEHSKAAVGAVIDTFIDAIPHFDILWLQLKKNLHSSEVIEDSAIDSVYSEDHRKLMDIFKQLWYCKNDEQQRSWPVHEDESVIGGLLVELNSILIDANPRVSQDVVRRNDYEMVNLLATYYQMEPRRTLRIKLLPVFLTVCELDVAAITQLLSSVLPMELARDAQDNFEDTEKVLDSTFLLSVIFSTGERPPTGTYDFINKKFLHFLFDKLEEVVKEGNEDMGQNLLSVVLAFNLHFEASEENIVLATLKEKQSAQVLTEKLVLLINREEDPCRILIQKEGVPNSVMKFLIDVFSCTELIDLFYLNDIKVLLDIIVRQLTDLLPGEKKRFEYLHLVGNLLRNSNYGEHLHQIEGLQKCFKFVLNQEFPEEDEVAAVLGIANEFRSWFPEI